MVTVKRSWVGAAFVLALAVSAVPAAAITPVASTHGKLPNPCKTFTTASLRTLLQSNPASPLQRMKFDDDGHPQCVVDYATDNFLNTFYRSSPKVSLKGHTRRYSRPKLGPHGFVEVKRTAPTIAVGDVNGFWYEVELNKGLPDKGGRMYHFALAERHQIKTLTDSTANASALGSSSGCATEADYNKTAVGQRIPKVDRLLHSKGTLLSHKTKRGYREQIRRYRTCSNLGVLKIQFEAKPHAKFKVIERDASFT
jgi:hypothetical protein